MSWADVGKSVEKYAPALGAALGGPVGAAVGGVGALIAGLFGGDASDPDSVLKAISLDPNAALKLKKFEDENRTKITEIVLNAQNTQLQNELLDKQDARKNNRNSMLPAVLSIILTLITSLILFALFFTAPPKDSVDLLYLLLGIVVREWGSSMQYWFGTTRGSSDKNYALGQIGSNSQKGTTK